MDISKIKTGKFVNYTTARGKTGRGKVVDITSNRGTWVVVQDKETKRNVSLRPGSLSA